MHSDPVETLLDNRSPIELILPGYQIRQQIYASASSLVYRAIREQDQQPVIFKILKPDCPRSEELTRYKQEYEILRRLNAAAIINVYGLDSYHNTLVLILEDFGGISLDHWLKEWIRVGTKAFPLSQFLRLARQVVAGLEQVHAAGIIHKNISSSNIVFNPDSGNLKLIDFGLATTLSRETPTLKSSQVLDETLAYLSPEQTGRMNRTLDYRTDFYSLGVTFYELLTGRLPFEASDAMELVHFHLAKTPIAPHDLNPALPPMVSNLVLKLMAKTPEDRYQSTRGLEHDLDVCGQHWQTQGRIPDFRLGRQDRAERFLIPEKLYGRVSEVETLLAAFERVAHGSTELMLVTGFSGIGKTAVINQIHKPIVQQRGYFIEGKFDQFHRNIPFMAFVQAFRGLIGQLLSESEVQQQQWRLKILSALGESARVILDVIPELERMIGVQPPIPDLSGDAAQNRFNLLFQKFITIFTTAEHPLVIFLDDLQWADSASLKLLHLLTTETQSGYLLLLGAYRDNEVSPSHPLRLTFDEIEKTGAMLNTITLSSLQQADINRLIADTLSCTPEIAFPLTKLVYQKTRGNPFFNKQFLNALYAEGFITFDQEVDYWQCDLAQVNALALTEDVIEFMAMQLQKLPPHTREVLKLAACIGNPFDLETLAIVHQCSQEKTAADLWPALQEGLVLPQSEVYKFFLGGGDFTTSTLSIQSELQIPSYRFLHDQVQQAAYSLIPEAQKQSMYLHIGQRLLKSTLEADREERIFKIVNQLNRGVALLTEPAARIELAQLNLIAGHKARDATAYKVAWDYFMVARQLLPEGCWQSQYDFTLNLYDCLVEAAYLNGYFETMEELVDIVRAETHSLLDTVRVYEVKIEALTAQNKLLASVNTGLQILELLGMKFPENPCQADIAAALRETHLGYQKKGVAELINLPLMTDTTQLAIMRILASILPPSFLSYPTLYTLLVLKQVDLSVRYGNTPASAYCYASYGLVLCGWVEEIETGYQFGQLALDLVHRLDAKKWQSKVPSVVHTFITHWKISVRDTLIPLRSAYDSGLEIGDFQYAGYSAFLYCAYAYFAGVGKELSELQRETVSLSESIYQMKQMTIFQYFEMLLQALHDVREGRTSSTHLKGEYYDEEMMMPHLVQAKDWNGIYYIHFHKLMLNYLSANYQQAVEDASRMEQYNDNAKSFPYEPIFRLYDSLTRLALQREIPQGNPETLRSRIAANQDKLKRWAQYAPMNCLHKFDLVEAEKQRTFGERAAAMEAYDRAIAGAKENGYLREEALANELAATFYLDWDKKKVAQAYMQAAYSAYMRWGGTSKTIQLEHQYADLLVPALGLHARQLRPVNTPLDLVTVIKASQAMAGEIELKQLLMHMMRIALENAGAQRGALILERAGDWVIEAQGAVDGEIRTLQALDLQGSATVSADVVYDVARTLTCIVLDDAVHKGNFTHDPYIIQHGIKSVLCAPLINQGRLSGIVYLENNLTTHAFTAERLELLNLLSTQMALSLDNARLYQKAQHEIAERKQAEAALRESEQRFRAIFDSVNDAIFVHDLATGDILDVNAKMCAMYGYTREESLRLKVGDLSAGDPPYSHADALVWIKRAADQEPQLFEWRAKDKNGRLFWEEVSMRKAIINGHDRLLVVARDITERKRIEEALEKRIVALTRPIDTAEGIDFEDLFNLADIQHLQDMYAEAFGVAALITHPDGTPITQPSNFSDLCGKIIRKTVKGAKNCNYSDAIIGKHNPCGPNIHPCLSAGLCNAGASITVGGRHIANWLIGQVRNETLDEEEIMKYAREIGADETAFRAAYCQVPIMPQEQFERVAHVIFVLANQISTSAYQNIQQARFIAERKRIEEAIKEEQRRTQMILETVTVPMLISRLSDGKVLFANPALAQIGHIDLEEFIAGYTVDYFANQADRDKIIEILKRQSYVSDFELQLRRGDGVLYWALLSARIINYQDETCILSSYVDISERKQAEAQLLQAQKMESIGRLAGGVAHDFNNMLSIILGYTELMKFQLSGNESLLTYLMEIEKAGLRSREITRQLLAFSRKQVISPQIVNLNDVVTSTQDTLARLIGEDVHLRFNPEKALWRIKFDPSQISLIIINLAVNARDAMPQGGTLKIETANVSLDQAYCREHPASKPGDYVLLEMSDNGIGMDKKTLSHIFEPFFTTKKLGEGTGLGLATVYGIVKQNDGFITLSSQPEQGTTFKIYIPRFLGDGEIAEKIEETQVASGAGTILLVEDDEMVRKLITEMLEKIGYTVLVAGTPSEILSSCEKNDVPIDLLITDVVMPGMSGPALKEKVEAVRPGMKVLFMSGYTSNVIAQRGVLEEGMHFIQKPFDLKDLAQKVRHAMADG